MHLPLEPTRVRQTKELTRKERQTVQVLPPFLRNSHSFALIHLRFGSEPSLVRICDQICNVVGMDSVENRVEVSSIWKSIPRVFVLHVLHDFRIVLELREDVIDA